MIPLNDRIADELLNSPTSSFIQSFSVKLLAVLSTIFIKNKNRYFKEIYKKVLLCVHPLLFDAQKKTHANGVKCCYAIFVHLAIHWLSFPTLYK